MSKAASQRLERAINELKTQVPGNNKCADCASSNPKWASWNLGIFLCVRCATLHRNMGTHISKVKSLTLDTWTKEQVDSMKRIGNIRSNEYYNPDTKQNPPPLNIEDDGRDSQLQRYIEQKYREKLFVVRTVDKGSSSSTSRAEEKARRPERLAVERNAPFAREPSPTFRATSPSPSPLTPTFSVTTAPSSPASTPSRRVDSSARHQPARDVPPRIPAIAPRPSSPALPTHNRLHAAHISRAATAPIPQIQRQASTTVLLNPYNPFNRQMTASANIPSTVSPPSVATNPYSGFQMNGFSSLTPQSDYQQAMQTGFMSSPSTSMQYIPQRSTTLPQAAAPQGGVWNDLAGLSLSSVPQNEFPASNGFSTSPSTSIPINSNPFLRSTPSPSHPSANAYQSSTFSPAAPSPSLPSGLTPAFQPQSQFGMANFGSPATAMTPTATGMSSPYNPFLQQSARQSSFSTATQQPGYNFVQQQQQQQQFQQPMGQFSQAYNPQGML